MVHLALFIDAEPMTIEETIKDEKWLNARKEELNSIERNHTWQQVPLPQHKVLLQ